MQRVLLRFYQILPHRISK